MEHMTISLSRTRAASGHQSISLDARQAILRALAYSDVFDYPPSTSELSLFLEAPAISQTLFEQTLQELLMTKTLILDGERVMLAGHEQLAKIWRLRQQHSAGKWRAARRFTALIRCLPFVHMVAITGSLAAHNADASADIDLFLITAPGRVWLTRAMTILIVRLAALYKVTLCPNYLVAADALEMSEHNLYTAHELVQMQPLYGAHWHHRLRTCNQWTLDYLPNAGIASSPDFLPLDHLPSLARLLKRVGEYLLAGRVGAALERWEMRRKVRKLQGQAPDEPAEASFSPAICKGHFEGHAARILRRFDERLASLSLLEKG
jgi:hypothetical protein